MLIATQGKNSAQLVSSPSSKRVESPGSLGALPREKERILQLLIEEVTYRSDGGEVAITFRPGGVRALAERGERKSA